MVTCLLFFVISLLQAATPLAIARKNILPLAKPYCFLLPSDITPEGEKCAQESVNAMVKEYEKAGVQLVVSFAWWGSNYSTNPDKLREQATEACDLKNRNPWMTGKNSGSIQVFTKHSVPNDQCKIPPEEVQKTGGVAGCSSLCEPGKPSFSTVSQDQCGPSVSIHESGHSNCCDRACHNEEDCSIPQPDEKAGCGLCMKQALNWPKNQFYAGKEAPEGSCSFTPNAQASLRAGASANPGFSYDPNRTYTPEGSREIRTIFMPKTTQVAKISFGSSDSDDTSDNKGTASNSSGEPRTMPRQSRSPSSGSGGSGTGGAANIKSSSPTTSSQKPKTYTEEQGANMMQGN